MSLRGRQRESTCNHLLKLHGVGQAKLISCSTNTKILSCQSKRESEKVLFGWNLNTEIRNSAEMPNCVARIQNPISRVTGNLWQIWIGRNIYTILSHRLQNKVRLQRGVWWMLHRIFRMNRNTLWGSTAVTVSLTEGAASQVTVRAFC